jgi:hypothetical protein
MKMSGKKCWLCKYTGFPYQAKMAPFRRGAPETGLSAAIPGAAVAQNKATELPLAIPWAHNCQGQLCAYNQAEAIFPGKNCP